MKPGLPWRTQDAEDAKVVGYMPRRASAQQKEVCCSPKDHSGIRHRNIEWESCPAGFQACFGPELPHYAPFPPFPNSNI